VRADEKLTAFRELAVRARVRVAYFETHRTYRASNKRLLRRPALKLACLAFSYHVAQPFPGDYVPSAVSSAHSGAFAAQVFTTIKRLHGDGLTPRRPLILKGFQNWKVAVASVSANKRQTPSETP